MACGPAVTAGVELLLPPLPQPVIARQSNEAAASERVNLFLRVCMAPNVLRQLSCWNRSMLAINIPENKICLGSAAHAGPKRYVAQGIGVSRCISARVGFASQPLSQTEVEVRRTAKKKLRVLGSAAGLGVVAGLRSM